MVQRQRLIIIVRSLITIQLNRLFEPVQRSIILLIFEITQPQIILCRSIILHNITCFAQIGNRLGILLDLSVAVAPMEQRLEVCLPTLNILNPLGKVLYCVVEIHQPRMYQSTIKIIYAVIRFE